MANVDILSQLLECSFKGVSFPTTAVGFSGSHGVVKHRRMDRNGAKLENTGLEAFTFHVTAPFCNWISRGKNETWDKLFPDTFNKFLNVLAERTTGDFIHPELGLRRCKVGSFKFDINPDFRNGVVLQFDLTEDSEDKDAVAILENATKKIAATAAGNLDIKIASLNPPIDTGLKLSGFENFLQFVNDLIAIFDTVGFLQLKYIGKIDRVIGLINKLQNSVPNPFELFGTDPTDLIISLIDIKNNALLNQSEILGFYKTLKKTTLLQLQLKFLNTGEELLSLNPELALFPTIPAYTTIRYYKK